MSVSAKDVRKLIEVYAHRDELGQYHFLTLPNAEVTEPDHREPNRDWFSGTRPALAGFHDIEIFDFNSNRWVREGKHSITRSLRKSRHFKHIPTSVYSTVEYQARAWIQARASETFEETHFNPRELESGLLRIGGPIGRTLTIVLIDISKQKDDANYVVGELLLPWQRPVWPDWHKQSNLRTVNALEFIAQKDEKDTKKALETLELLGSMGINIEEIKKGNEQVSMQAREALEKHRCESLTGERKLKLESSEGAAASAGAAAPNSSVRVVEAVTLPVAALGAGALAVLGSGADAALHAAPASAGPGSPGFMPLREAQIAQESLPAVVAQMPPQAPVVGSGPGRVGFE